MGVERTQVASTYSVMIKQIFNKTILHLMGNKDFGIYGSANKITSEKNVHATQKKQSGKTGENLSVEACGWRHVVWEVEWGSAAVSSTSHMKTGMSHTSQATAERRRTETPNYINNE